MTEHVRDAGADATMSADDFAAWNEQMVERYDIDRYYERSHALVRWVETRRIRELVRLAAAQPGARVLEVGCGAGHVLQQFEGTIRTGIDLSPTMLDRARRRLPSSVTLMQGSAEKLPVGDACFDVVICTEVLEHVQDPAQVIRELARAAAPEARIVVSIPNEAVIDTAKRIIRRIPVVRSALRTLASEGNEWHLHRMDLHTLRSIIERPLAVEETRAVPSRVMPLRWAVRLGRR